MATAIGKVAAVFTASTSGLTAGVNQAGRSMKKLEGDVRGLRSGLNLLTAIQGAQLFGQITAGVSQAVSSFMNMAGAQADVIDSTSKLAARLGFTYGEMAGLALAADLSGVSMDQIAAAATKADVAFVKAANGSKTARATFDRLGLSMETLNGMSASERFDAIAAAIAALPTEAERAAAAVQIFGRAGAELLPLFSQGAAGIAAARAEAEAFGLTLTNEQGQNVEAMNDAFTRAQQAIQGVVGQIVAYLSPAVESVTTAFSDFIGSVGGANIGQAIGAALLEGAQFFAGIADWVIAGIGGVFEYASAVGESWAVGWELGTRVGNLLYGAFKTFEAVGNIIGGLFSDIIAGLLRSGAAIADAIPGFQATADSLNASADGWAAQGDQFAASMNSNLNAASTAFGNAFGESAAAAAPAAVGPVSQMIEDARRRAEQAAAQRDTAARQTVGPQAVAPASLGPSTEALRATDSTSKEGIAEMFRLMRGTAGNVQEEQLGVLEEIRDTLREQPGDEWTEAAFAGT
jgi:hypothetical protein